MQVYVPELEIAEPGDKLDAHALSQEKRWCPGFGSPLLEAGYSKGH